MALDLDFGVLFPASDIHGHVVKGDLLLEELVHLLLDRVLITRLDKRCGVVDARHRIEVFMLPGVHSAHSEVVVEQVLTVSTIWNAIVNQ